MPSEPEWVANELVPIPLEEDFQIIVAGRPRRSPSYRFHRLIDNEWVQVLVVHTGNPDEIYRVYGRGRDQERERVYAESFFDLLEPGEYILEAQVSWGTLQQGEEGQYFFRLIK